jgi:hypothetical protein
MIRLFYSARYNDIELFLIKEKDLCHFIDGYMWAGRYYEYIGEL